MVTRANNNITKKSTKFTLMAEIPMTLETEPNKVTEALKDKRWRKAMSAETDSHLREHTSDLVSPDPSYNLVGNKWVFRIKQNADGSLERFKARLVAKGFHQRSGINYHETFSPVIKPATIRIVLDVAVSDGLLLRQLDVNNSFLQGHLKEDVYMSQSIGFIDKDNPEYVCKLCKVLYGLKQAPCAWYMDLRSFLLESGFANSLADASLFILRAGKKTIYTLVYVDDIIVTGNNSSHVLKFIELLSEHFSLKDHGDLSYFLGIEATRSSSGLHLCQQKYINDLLACTNMSSAKSVATPMTPNDQLQLTSGNALTDGTEYRMVIGSLQYLHFTCPNIAFAVNNLSQFMHRPTDLHWQAAKRVLRYLAGTRDNGIFLRSNNKLTLHAFFDADWAGNYDDFTSTSAHIVYLGANPVTSSSKKQKTVARSSTEVEYRAVADTAAELRWITNLLNELGLKSESQPVIYCDNIGATYICANPVFHSRIKHVGLDYHFIRELVQSGFLRVSHV